VAPVGPDGTPRLPEQSADGVNAQRRWSATSLRQEGNLDVTGRAVDPGTHDLTVLSLNTTPAARRGQNSTSAASAGSPAPTVSSAVAIAAATGRRANLPIAAGTRCTYVGRFELMA
jgi:hypothetical protein